MYPARCAQNEQQTEIDRADHDTTRVPGICGLNQLTFGIFTFLVHYYYTIVYDARCTKNKYFTTNTIKNVKSVIYYNIGMALSEGIVINCIGAHD